MEFSRDDAQLLARQREANWRGRDALAVRVNVQRPFRIECERCTAADLDEGTLHVRAGVRLRQRLEKLHARGAMDDADVVLAVVDARVRPYANPAAVLPRVAGGGEHDLFVSSLVDR